jgi:hypothetical protein
VESTGGALLLLGAVSMVAAIVGGNVTLPGGATFGALTGRGVRAALSAFSVVLLLLGTVLLLGRPSPAPPTPSPSPVVSGGGSAPSPSPTTQPSPPVPATTGPSRAAFVAAAEAVCAEGERRELGVPDPGESGTAQEQAAYFAEQRAIVQDVNTGLRGLLVPAGDEGEVEALWQAHDRYLALLEELTAAVAREDAAALVDVESRAERVVGDFDARAQGYGLDGCVVVPS